MDNLTFGEQVKIILGRKGMTIKELAEIIEERTGKKMSRQNLTQRLGRDNFQEQDMRMIAGILGCPFHLSIMGQEMAEAPEKVVREAAVPNLVVLDSVQKNEEQPSEQEWKLVEKRRQQKAAQKAAERAERERLKAMQMEEEIPAPEPVPGPEEAEEVDMTIGDLYKMHKELDELEEETTAKPKRSNTVYLRKNGHPVDANGKEVAGHSSFLQQKKMQDEKAAARKAAENKNFEPVIKHKDEEEDLERGERNPYTGREYQSNSVRMHPNRIGYVQVYDRKTHKWTDMTEWAFLGYQERKKVLLGKDYEPPIYLD